MKRRNGKKDGRGKTSARKAPGAGSTLSLPRKRLARSKANTSESSVLLSVAGKSDNLTNEERIETLEWGLVNSRQKIVEMIEDLAKVYSALEDLMCFYNRATEPGRDGHGWTAADVQRLEEIRALLMPHYVEAKK